MEVVALVVGMADAVIDSASEVIAFMISRGLGCQSDMPQGLMETLQHIQGALVALNAILLQAQKPPPVERARIVPGDQVGS